MGLRLSVRRAAWEQSVAATAAKFPGLIPVVKGNGYGFGRRVLMPIAAGLADRIAVGSVYEVADVPIDRIAVVLTPHIGDLPVDLDTSSVLTVGSVEHVRSLGSQEWLGNVAIKLSSSMNRYGVDPPHLETVVGAVTRNELGIDSFALHLPLVGTPRDRVDEIETWLPHLDPKIPVAISHVDSGTFAELVQTHADRSWRTRIGTALWHGDKSNLHLSADVLQVRRVAGGDSAGYRAATVPGDGWLVLIAAGSAHGVRTLDDGRSPFHHRRLRMQLVEPPHMHTSIAFVPDSCDPPGVGDRVDVQRPLIETSIDELEWIGD